MTKTNPLITKPVTDLMTAILKLKTVDEARRFFRDLLTEGELLEFANRWRVAKMLQAKIPYTQIEQQTGMSSTTIARINKWLTNGMGGYQLILNRISENKSSPRRRGQGEVSFQKSTNALLRGPFDSVEVGVSQRFGSRFLFGTQTINPVPNNNGHHHHSQLSVESGP